MKIILIVAPGFEEGETVEIADILIRAKFEVDIVSIADELVEGANGITIKSDRIMGDQLSDLFGYDMLVLPGGWTGVDNLLADDRVIELVRYYSSHDRYIGAMCAAPNVLAKAGVIKGKNMTAYPGQKTEPFYTEANYLTDTVVVDGKLITSRGPATALPFAFALVDALHGDSNYIKKRLLYNELKTYDDFSS